LEVWSENFRKIYYILFKIGLYFEPLIRKKDSAISAFKLIKVEISEVISEGDPLRKLESLIDSTK